MKCEQKFNIFGVAIYGLDRAGVCWRLDAKEIEEHRREFAVTRPHQAVCTYHVCMDAFEEWVHRTLAEGANQ